MSVNIDPQVIYQKLEQRGHEWVHAEAKARLLEESQKSELSTIMLEFIDKGKSAAESEARARASDKYKAFVKEMVQAREEANEAKVTYEAAKTWFEALRTQAATLRQEMKSLG